ncbi:hypothetical protein E4P29_15800 [Rhodococcus sp. 1R11]|uniref:hypothetical protein n=1 Tax=Rhodococcus sp. 1R11 TaxID=2559614 RepID=UPI001071B37A|nr:hypothetical protein [Rhodococcus sp. 1R11]TFI42522.1 hypothetical protein E4P29_15800 [Rhodococcus sp. 1R11]
MRTLAELEVMDGVCPESIHNIEFGGPYSFGWAKQLGGGSITYPFVAMLAAQTLAGVGIYIAYRTRPDRDDFDAPVSGPVVAKGSTPV